MQHSSKRMEIHQSRLTPGQHHRKPADSRHLRSIGYNPVMHDIPNRIADVLLEIESILRTYGLWDSRQPAVNELSSTEPFCLDTLRFEQWLQWIFLPRMKQIIEHGKPLPRKSGIHVYAEEYFQKKNPPGSHLLRHIKRFDDLITIQSGVSRH